MKIPFPAFPRPGRQSRLPRVCPGSWLSISTPQFSVTFGGLYKKEMGGLLRKKLAGFTVMRSN